MGNPQDCERFLLAMDAVLSQSTRQPRKDAPQFVLSAIVTVHQKSRQSSSVTLASLFPNMLFSSVTYDAA
jgi:hypothetical protein